MPSSSAPFHASFVSEKLSSKMPWGGLAVGPGLGVRSSGCPCWGARQWVGGKMSSNCGHVSFLPTRIWAQEIGLFVQGGEHLACARGSPWSPWVSGQAHRAGGPQSCAGGGQGTHGSGGGHFLSHCPPSLSLSLFLVSREYFYFGRPKREKGLVIRKTKELMFFKTPESLCLRAWGRCLWRGRAASRKS